MVAEVSAPSARGLRERDLWGNRQPAVLAVKTPTLPLGSLSASESSKPPTLSDVLTQAWFENRAQTASILNQAQSRDLAIVARSVFD